MKNKIDYSLYVITDRQLMTSESIEQSIEDAILGGAGIIQIREKNITSKEFYLTAKNAKAICSRLGAALIINDRIDIALACDADGVHLGQKDIPVDTARRIMGKNAIIGASAATVKEAVQAQRLGADYLGVGAIFTTETKKDTRSVSKELLKDICSAVSIPVVAIGGINKERAYILEGSGVKGAAVVSAVVAQNDIKAAAKEMKAEILKYIGESL